MTITLEHFLATEPSMEICWEESPDWSRLFLKTVGPIDSRDRLMKRIYCIEDYRCTGGHGGYLCLSKVSDDNMEEHLSIRDKAQKEGWARDDLPMQDEYFQELMRIYNSLGGSCRPYNCHWPRAISLNHNKQQWMYRNKKAFVIEPRHALAIVRDSLKEGTGDE